MFRLDIRERAEGVHQCSPGSPVFIFLGRFLCLLVSRTFISPRELRGACIPFHLACVCCAAVLASRTNFFSWISFLAGWQHKGGLGCCICRAHPTADRCVCVWNEFTLWCAWRLFALCRAHFLLAGPWAHAEDSRKRNLAPFVSSLNER